MDGIPALHPAAPGLILGVPKNFYLLVDQNNGQRLENVNKIHRVLSSGKLILEKKVVLSSN